MIIIIIIIYSPRLSLFMKPNYEFMNYLWTFAWVSLLLTCLVTKLCNID